MMTKKSIIIDNENFEYFLDKGNRKFTKMYITAGMLIIKTTKRKTQKAIDNFIKKNYKWICEKLSKPTNIKKPVFYENGETIYIFNLDYKLNIFKSKNSQVKIFNKDLYVYTGRAKVETVVDKFLDNMLFEYITAKINEYSQITSLNPQSIILRKLNRTWGICSSLKVITFNKSLIHYPKQAIDYIIIHELCHLKYMSHSKEFWELVEFYMPDYKQRQELLK